MLQDIKIQLEQIHKVLSDNANFLQSLTHVVSIIGVPVAILIFYSKYRKEHIARGEEIYKTIDELWVNFNALILRYPHLDVAFIDSEPRQLTSEEQVQQYVIFDVLTTMLERAYLAYLSASGRQRRQQWRGWEAYIDHYCRKKSYRDWWFRPDHISNLNDTRQHDSQYDARFQSFMMDRFKKTGSER